MAKRKKSRKAKSSSKPRKHYARRVGALHKPKHMKSMKGLGSGLMKDLIAPVPTGIGIFGARYLNSQLPIEKPWVRSLILYGGGVVLTKMKLGGIAQGVGGEGIASLIENFVPIPGRVSGIGMLTPEEVELIERTAMTDRVNGIVDETVYGGPYRQRQEVY